MDVIKAVETDGDEMIDVRPGSIIIKILCQSMSNWINLCEKCIDGRMTQLFKSLQDHLRKSTSFGNLTITVDMLESDFIESVDTIVKQLYPYMIAALPHNIEMHRPDGIENTKNVQHMNAMLKCLLEKSHQYSHQKPQMQIDNGLTTWFTVDQTCMETKTHQNETPPTSETLLVQNTFSGRHTDLNVKEDVKSTDLEACDRKIDINCGSDGPENGNIQNVMSSGHDATQQDMEKDHLNKQEENAELICEIAELCNRPDRKDPEVLLLLGSVGAGKSALVNTIIKAMTGKYIHKAKADVIDFVSQRFENCGIEKYDLQGLQKEAFSNCLHKLPNIIIVPGMSVEQSANIRELLEAVFGGFIPPRTSVKYLQKLQKDYGVDCLQKMYPSNSKEWAVTRVVFVASAFQSLPTALVEIVRSLLETHDQATGYFKYNIDLFVVITKCDLVEGFNTSEKTSDSNMIKRHQFKEMENEVAKEFSIGGAMEHNSIRWQSYVDGRCLDDPYIDNIALKFVRQMMQPRRRRHPVESDKTPVLTPQKMFLFKLTKAVNDMNADEKLAFLVGIFVALVVVYVSLSQTVKTAS
ncbi:hypothetical protein DPMN_154170 [Dreissena polymorpha]|uniref:Uncharacterized protein n=1 Tax=Dreissena polymorpha TaxID=45954 RepID=A0A9D4FR97_DREPO|nr:hypothetical protein DPMN_154170 [Dreissena polymorpha]